MPLSPELQRLAADLDKQFAAEDLDIEREIAERARKGEAEPEREIKTYGFGNSPSVRARKNPRR